MKKPIALSNADIVNITTYLNKGQYVYITNKSGEKQLYGFYAFERPSNKIKSDDFSQEIIEKMEKALSCGDDIQVKVEHENTITIIKLDRKLLGKIIKA